jgi:2-desacetyl-2-hydroxyethyl bacteriochlorophyllide A dehydrogenase
MAASRRPSERRAGEQVHSVSPGSVPARAVWFTGPRRAELLAEEVRSPGAGEVLVRAVASLVSAGTEMIVYRGETRSRSETDLPTSAGEYPFPIKFSYQVVGEVEEAGPQSGFAPGDRVFAYHPHQSRFTMAAGRVGGGLLAPQGRTLLFAVPDTLDDDHAVFANLFGVALTCLLDVPVRIGDCVALSGLGVVGSFAAHFARRTAGRLVLVDPLASRRERAAWIGADAVVHPDDAPAAIEEYTEGRGVDIYIEASGAPRALQSAIEGTGKEGTIAVVAYYGGNKPVPLLLAPEFHIRRQKIVSSQNATIGSGLQPRWDTERRMGVVMEQLADLDTAHLISHRFPFSRAPEAYRLLDEHHDDAFGVILDYQQEA